MDAMPRRGLEFECQFDFLFYSYRSACPLGWALCVSLPGCLLRFEQLDAFLDRVFGGKSLVSSLKGAQLAPIDQVVIHLPANVDTASALLNGVRQRIGIDVIRHKRPA